MNKKNVVCRDISHEQGQQIQRQNSQGEQIRTLLDRQREQILADCQAEIRKHEFQADNDRRRSFQKMSETNESQQEELHRAQAEERRRQDHQLLHEQLLKQNWYFREAHEKSLKDMEELKRFHGSTFDTIARRKLVEDQDTILELTGKIQELQNEINCMNDSRDFQDAESVRSGHSHVTSQPVSLPRHPIPGGMLSRSIGMPSRKDGPPSFWDTHGISGNVFLQIQLHLHQHLIRRNRTHGVLTYQNQFTHQRLRRMRIKHQFKIRDASPDRQPKNSIITSEGDSSKIYGADQQRLQISDLHFDKFPTPATFACWKIRFKTEVYTCSQVPSDTMLWIKEVEMVQSVDDLKSSLSVRGIQMPDFEVLDARIASALNRIIHNSHFKRRVSLEEQKAQKEDRLLRGRQIAYLIYEYFRVTGTNNSVENYADLFTIALRYDDIQEFDSKWDGILLSMTKIPPDGILEGLYKI